MKFIYIIYSNLSEAFERTSLVQLDYCTNYRGVDALSHGGIISIFQVQAWRRDWNFGLPTLFVVRGLSVGARISVPQYELSS